MTDQTSDPRPTTPAEDEEFAAQIADQIESFLLALRAIARGGDGAQAVSLLLLEISQVLLAGARLGAQMDFQPREEYQPDVGPEADIDEMRLRLARMLDSVDTYSFVFDPYLPDVVQSQLSDDLTSIAIDLDNGLRHYKLGNVAEALWWWQFSYVNNWGNLAGAALNALLTVVAHDRFDTDFEETVEALTVAHEMLDEPAEPPR